MGNGKHQRTIVQTYYSRTGGERVRVKRREIYIAGKKKEPWQSRARERESESEREIGRGGFSFFFWGGAGETEGESASESERK